MKYYLKDGWTLNPNEKVRKAIEKAIERCNGDCPCANTGRDIKCPCSDFREENICHCNLYIKSNGNTNT